MLNLEMKLQNFHIHVLIKWLYNLHIKKYDIYISTVYLYAALYM